MSPSSSSPPNFIDFTNLSTCRNRETPGGLPSLSKYKPSSSNDTVVIDTGSWQYRAGFSSHTLPALVFDPIVHRYQIKTGDSALFHIGRQAPPGASRSSSRTPFEDGNVILHFPSLEHIMDDIFSKLSVQCKNESLLHPIFMTEVVTNPPVCRKETSELLFEAYNVPKIAYGVDGPLSYFENEFGNFEKDNETCLIISVGNFNTIITVVIKGKVDPSHVKRINFGGNLISQSLLQMMQCKYPSFPTKMTLWQAQEVIHRVCKFASDYDETLSSLTNDDNLRKCDVVIQYPYSTESLAEKIQREQARESLAAKRKEQAERLRERLQKQKADKLEAKRQQIESMGKLLKQVLAVTRVKKDGSYDDEAEESTLDELRLFGYENVEELENALEQEKRELDRLLGVEGPKAVPDYSLLEIPDSELSPDQIKEKRKQRLLKNSADARDRLKKEKELKERKLAEQKDNLEKKRINDFDKWKFDLYSERFELLGKIKTKQKAKEALSDRRSQASGARLKNVVSLVADDEDAEPPTKQQKKRKTKKQPEKSENEEGFGDDDADWLIYRQISKDEDNPLEGEEEDWQKRIEDIEAELERYDNENFYKVLAEEMQSGVTILEKLRYGVDQEPERDPNATANQLHVNVERFRTVEGLFQPSSIYGIDQAGLIETIEDLLKIIPSEYRQVLLENVFVTGGSSKIDNLFNRLEIELQTISPVNTAPNLKFASDPILDTWKGAAKLCREQPTRIPWITRSWYDENGGERLPFTTWFTNQF